MSTLVPDRAFVDALGRTHRITAPPWRIVSLVPSLTEALFAFGLGECVAGVTRYCVEPAADVALKPKIGGTKNVDVAQVAALQPDLVLANVEENTQSDVAALEAAGLRVFLTYARTVSEAIAELAVIASMAGAEEAARPIVEGAKEALADALAANARRRAPPTFCPIWRNPWMTIGPDTYIHDVLESCGAANVYADAAGRYPVLDLAEVASRRPEVVLLPDEPYRFGEKHVPEVVETLPGVRIHLVDGKMLGWYGPRIAESLRSLQRIIHGETHV
jgi:ABC-type Fe3+-hydroxamate transport system substrate-binding protein